MRQPLVGGRPGPIRELSWTRVGKRVRQPSTKTRVTCPDTSRQRWPISSLAQGSGFESRASTTVPPTNITEHSLTNKSSHAHVVGWHGGNLSQSYIGKPWDWSNSRFRPAT